MSGEAASARTIDDLERIARERMVPEIYHGMFGYGDDWYSRNRRENVEAFRRIKFRLPVLRSMSEPQLEVEIQGRRTAFPLILAPVANHMRVHPDGELASARAAGSAGVILTVGVDSSRTLEEIASVATAPLWLEIYAFNDVSITEMLIRRAEAAGYAALVLSVDTNRAFQADPIEDTSDAFRRFNFVPPERRATNLFASDHARRALNLSEASVSVSWPFGQWIPARPTWDDVKRLLSLTSLPLIVKGIHMPADAVACSELGVAGIVVSNHGGRIMPDTTPTIEDLADVVAAVGDRLEIYLDSGVRMGSDILKAAAMGARAVMAGSPLVWGLAAQGEAGVRKAIDIFRGELEFAMRTSLVSDMRAVPADILAGPAHEAPVAARR